MAKIIDITDKLNFEEKPQITIKGKSVEVNDTAVAILEIMPKLNEGATPSDIYEVYKILFDEKARKVIDGFNLNFSDFQELITTAISLVVGDEKAAGETSTPATTL